MYKKFQYYHCVFDYSFVECHARRRDQDLGPVDQVLDRLLPGAKYAGVERDV